MFYCIVANTNSACNHITPCRIFLVQHFFFCFIFLLTIHTFVQYFDTGYCLFQSNLMRLVIMFFRYLIFFILLIVTYSQIFKLSIFFLTVSYLVLLRFIFNLHMSYSFFNSFSMSTTTLTLCKYCSY